MGASGAPLEDGVISLDIPGRAFDQRPVLGPVAFSVAPGEVLAILGPSGAGKTTLLRIAAGIDHGAVGQVRRPQRIAAVFQEPTLLPWRTVLQNLTVVHPQITPEQARSMLERVGLGGEADLFPGQLSLGQQRRLAIARAFAGRPELLLLDEPFVSLDPATATAMADLTAELIADTKPATILVTHSRAEADRLATRQMSLSGRPAVLRPMTDDA